MHAARDVYNTSQSVTPYSLSLSWPLNIYQQSLYIHKIYQQLVWVHLTLDLIHSRANVYHLHTTVHTMLDVLVWEIQCLWQSTLFFIEFYWYKKKWNCFGTFNVYRLWISLKSTYIWCVINYSCIILTWHSIISTLITHNTCTIFLLHWYMLCHGACVFLHVHVSTCMFTWIISVLFFHATFYVWHHFSILLRCIHIISCFKAHTYLHTPLNFMMLYTGKYSSPFFFHPFSPSCQ